ncbi:glycosyltransferase [Luminiphilus sp.]|nr:glycosyltransferase [Luminiphilus sp.]
MFSVCIPFLQNEPFLRELLQSIETVANVEMEILVSQDAPVSNDLKQHFQEQLPIRWLTGPNRGIAANWNNCIEHAEGEYIVLFHADDTVLPNYFDIILDLQREYPSCAAWFSGASVIDAKGSITTSLIDRAKSALTPRPPAYRLKGDEGLARLLLGCFIYCPTVCYRASVLKSHPFDEGRKMVLDLDLYSRLLRAGETVAGSNSIGYNYRRHKGGQSGVLTDGTSRFVEEVDFYNSLVGRLHVQEWPRSARQAKLKVFVRLHILFELSRSLLSLDGQRAIKLWKLLFL